MSNTVGGISNIRATDGGNIASFRSKDSKIGQYIDVNSERVVINYMENGEWKTGIILASKSDLNTVLMYRGVVTGDLNRGRNLAIAPGIYSIQSVSTITNGPSDFVGWGIFVQFPDNLFSQMILNSPNYIKFRKYSGSNPTWSEW